MRVTSCLSSLLLLFIAPFSLVAQHWVTGTITDGETGQPIEYAQVAVLTADSSMINGDVTDGDGYFEISRIESGNYLLRASYVGYGIQWMTIEVGSENLDVGELTMTEGAEDLDEVTIEAAATVFRSEGDRRIYSVGELSVTEGGSAIDLLEIIPSIQIDQEGNLSMRGSGDIAIHINGRPTNLSSDEVESVLEQYPSHAIQDVELITNPSARYDAEGSGGIINIVLKEEKRNGFRGQADASAGTGHKYSGGLNLNYRQDRLNIFTHYNYQYRRQWVGNITERQNKSELVSPTLEQEHNADRINQTHLIRSGVEYNFTLEHQVKAFGTLNLRSRDQEREFDIRHLDNMQMLDSQLVRNVNEDQSRTNREFGVEYLWEPADREDQQFHAMVTYADERQDQTEHFEQTFYDADENVLSNKRQLYDRPGKGYQLIGQADYEGPVTPSLDMEGGLKSTLSHESRSQLYDVFDFDEDAYVTDEVISQDFVFDEDVHAAYMTIKGETGRLNYQAGLRAEYTATESYQPAIDSVYPKQYANLFPSTHLNYRLTESQDLQASYSRRIQRPNVRQLSPFLNVQDQSNLRRGNPYLEPEFNNNYEISHIRGWEKFNLTSSIFHRETRNAMTRILTTHDEQTTITTWDNAATRNATGAEVIKYYEYSSRFDARLTSEFYHSLIEGDDGEQNYRNQTFSYGFTLLSNMRIPNWFNIQLSANYRGPRPIPQGRIEPRYHVDLGIRRRVLDDQGTLSLNINDILNSRQFTIHTENESFVQTRRFERESRIANISFTYRFSDGEDGF